MSGVQNLHGWGKRSHYYTLICRRAKSEYSSGCACPSHARSITAFTPSQKSLVQKPRSLLVRQRYALPAYPAQLPVQAAPFATRPLPQRYVPTTGLLAQFPSVAIPLPVADCPLAYESYLTLPLFSALPPPHRMRAHHNRHAAAAIRVRLSVLV